MLVELMLQECLVMSKEDRCDNMVLLFVMINPTLLDSVIQHY